MHDEPTYVAIERFMARGKSLRGSVMESTCMTIGFILGNLYSVPEVALVTPAAWKNAYNSKRKKSSGSLNDDYKSCGTTPHQLDAVLIGTYAAAKMLDVDPFNFATDERRTAKFLRNVEKAASVG